MSYFGQQKKFCALFLGTKTGLEVKWTQQRPHRGARISGPVFNLVIIAIFKGQLV